jgi:hypothetical protein
MSLKTKDKKISKELMKLMEIKEIEKFDDFDHFEKSIKSLIKMKDKLDLKKYASFLSDIINKSHSYLPNKNCADLSNASVDIYKESMEVLIKCINNEDTKSANRILKSFNEIYHKLDEDEEFFSNQDFNVKSLKQRLNDYINKEPHIIGNLVFNKIMKCYGYKLNISIS